MDDITEKINEYSAATLRLASPEEIKSWGKGEVKKPETINHRTLKPEKDGLFCERIFGPEKDFECSCGKYKGVKYKGLVCDRCGVSIIKSFERRKRMGYINLACPVAHIWYFKIMPSKVGAILNMKLNQLERIIYYQDYVVTDVKDKNVPLNQKQILTEDEYRMYSEKYRDAFVADTGASALLTLLQKVNIEDLIKELRKQLQSITSEQAYSELVKRLLIIEKFAESGNKPEWVILTCIPVIPPELRPLILLESGVFATSDLNDLYRRLINRNNRLKKLIELNAPDVIIRNEKRMLQQAVDALLDNTRCRRPVLAANNRPLKSLSDIIKGKEGRFRENLLGKRVDYSGRSVIVVGPTLKLHQCGLPKKIALELFQPFIIQKLKERGIVDSLPSARKMISKKEEIVFDILDEIIHGKFVLLNRAPTLHRMGIEAFQPILVEGDAITIHPLVCTPFNADFDGDQMAVHLPLSFEAQIEAKTLMLSTWNIFSPQHGAPVMPMIQDMVLGLAFLTMARRDKKGQGKVFATIQEAIAAYDNGIIDLQAIIKVRISKQCNSSLEKKADIPKNGLVETTVGRIIFNEALYEQLPYYNFEFGKKQLNQLLVECYYKCGLQPLIKLLDNLKDLGFKYATKSGLSLSKDDLVVPRAKHSIVSESNDKIKQIEKAYHEGIVTPGERYNQIIDVWINAREKLTKELIKMFETQLSVDNVLNPLYLIVNSGARGNMDQVRQLSGMRGLMAKPSGEIIETPVLGNFIEGLNILEYFSSTHGGRKGLADTALKTADAGYLTRRLVDVAQNVIINKYDCGTLRGITKSAIYKGNRLEVPLHEAIYGRTARYTITDIVTDEIIVKENELITEEIAKKIESHNYQSIKVRSPLTCESPNGVCALCYGMDLSRIALVEEGLPVGIIAAQSIGEPGTQLTMRTFHIGGVAVREASEAVLWAKQGGKIKTLDLKIANYAGNQVVINRGGKIQIIDDKARLLDELEPPIGSHVMVKEGSEVQKGAKIVEWDPHNIPIVATNDGTVVFEDLVLNKTFKKEQDPKNPKIVRKVTIEHRGELQPGIVIKDKSGNTLEFHPLPERTNIEVDEGQHVKAGQILAKYPRAVGSTDDITGGLPRITELFEARSPKDPAVIAKIDGIVELGDKKRGKREIIIRNSQTGVKVKHEVPSGSLLKFRTGDVVKAGDPLVEGPLVPREILKIKGEEEVQKYLLDGMQSVYRAQGVKINDKHFEIIISQMMRKVLIKNAGDTRFLKGAIIDKYVVKQENDKMKELKKKPATFEPLILGISKAAIQSESFISAASFQETTKVLSESAIAGRRDELKGLKENVIIGHLIPAGTGYQKFMLSPLKKEEVETEVVA